MSQEVSDLWRASTTSAVNVCGSFTLSEFAAALKHLKPGKAPGPDSICPELLLHAGAALKSWLYGFLSSCLHHLKIPKIWRRALVVAIPKPMKPVEDPKSYRLISLLCVPTRSSRGLFTPVSSPLSTRFFLGSKLGSDRVGPQYTNLFYLPNTSTTHLRPRRKPVLFLSI